MKLTYHVTKVVTETKTVEIENENFITIQHRMCGSTQLTAFVGKGEAVYNKVTITVSKGGGILDIEKMAGTALLNAQILLSSNSYNTVVPNREFLKIYNTEKKVLML